MAKIIIESAVNGMNKRARNTRIPYTTGEIIDDALATCDAGASMIHYHVLGPEGEWSDDIGDYGDVIRGIRASNRIGAGAVLWPTFASGENIAERFRHYTELSKDPATKPDLGACDMGSLNLLRWDTKANSFAKHNVYVNSVDSCREVLALMKDAGLKRPTLQVFDGTHLRTILKFLELGLLEEPLVIKFYLGGPEMPFGMPPTPKTLEAYVDMMQGVRAIWFAACFGGDILPLVPHAIAMGGHVRVGLEDHHYADEGRPSNADLVERAAVIVRAMGHEVATPQEARAMMEI
jgi:3-keto-5-aminohexanoate cleavage enzyme